MNDDSATIDSLIKGGLIGAFLGAILLKDKEEGAVIGALLGAAISATQRANEIAQNAKVPLYVEENGNLYLISPNGVKQHIKTLTKPTKIYPRHFQLD